MKQESTFESSSYSTSGIASGTETESNSSSVVNYLEDLYARAHDAREGYQKAAELTESQSLKQFFGENSVQRSEFALELEGLLRTMGEEPDGDASILGKVHQGWMHIVSKFSEGEANLLSECQRGEEAALESYEETLNTMELPNPVAGAVERQRDRVRGELAKLRELEVAALTQS